jgi:hypothetical protein
MEKENLGVVTPAVPIQDILKIHHQFSYLLKHSYKWRIEKWRDLNSYNCFPIIMSFITHFDVPIEMHRCLNFLYEPQATATHLPCI